MSHISNRLNKTYVIEQYTSYYLFNTFIRNTYPQHRDLYINAFNPYRNLVGYNYNYEVADKEKQIKGKERMKIKDMMTEVFQNINLYKYYSRVSLHLNEIVRTFGLVRFASNKVLEISNNLIMTDILQYNFPNVSLNLYIDQSYNTIDENFVKHNLSKYTNVYSLEKAIEKGDKYSMIVIDYLLDNNSNLKGLLWEYYMYRRSLYYIYNCLKLLEKRGCLIYDIMEVTTDFNIDLLSILSECFSDVKLYTPNIAKPLLNIIRGQSTYLICTGFKSFPIKFSKIFEKLINKYSIKANTLETFFSKSLQNYYKSLYSGLDITLNSGYENIIKLHKDVLAKDSNFPLRLLNGHKEMIKVIKVIKVINMINKFNEERLKNVVDVMQFIKQMLHSCNCDGKLHKILDMKEWNTFCLTYCEHYALKYKLNIIRESNTKVVGDCKKLRLEVEKTYHINVNTYHR